MTMTNPTPHGQVPAIQRYKIGYHSDEWGVRSLSPTGVYDDAGPWVRYEDHAAVITALRTQQPAPATQPATQQGTADGFFLLLPQRPKPEAPAGTAGLDWDAYSGTQMLAFGRDCSDAAITALRTQQPAPATQQAVGSSGFDYKTAADFLSGKTISDEALRKFVAASRGAHDDRAALRAQMLALRGVLASREAEIALLKRSLLDAEAAAHQPSPTAQAAESVPAVDGSLEVADAMADSQYLAGVSAGWNAANADDPNAALQKLHESRAGYLKPLSAARAPAESVLEDAALSGEQQRAIFEAHESAASEGYFEARPQIDCNDGRRVFKAGYERGWDAARKQGGA